MSKKKRVLAALLLLCATFTVSANFIVIGPDGYYYECWYELQPDGSSEVRCMLLDHMPPIDP